MVVSIAWGECEVRSTDQQTTNTWGNSPRGPKRERARVFLAVRKTKDNKKKTPQNGHGRKPSETISPAGENVWKREAQERQPLAPNLELGDQRIRRGGRVQFARGKAEKLRAGGGKVRGAIKARKTKKTTDGRGV